jgi:hypothetical protein
MVRQHHHAFVALEVFCRCERAPRDRSRPEHGQQCCRDPRHLDVDRLATAAQGLLLRRDACQRFQRGHSRSPLEEVAGRGRNAGIQGCFERDHLADDHKAIGVRVGERSQQNGIDEREDPRVRANTDRDEQDDQRAEPRLTPDHAHAVAEVVGQRVERREAADIAILFADLIAAAKAPPRLALRRLERPALLPQIGNQQREVQIDLLVVIAQPAAASDERPHAAQPAVQAHGRSSAGVRNRASTAEMWDQRAVSF